MGGKEGRGRESERERERERTEHEHMDRGLPRRGVAVTGEHINVYQLPLPTLSLASVAFFAHGQADKIITDIPHLTTCHV